MREMKNSGIDWIGNIPKSWTITILSALFSERKCKNSGLVENNLLSLSYGNIVRKNIESNEGLLPASFEAYNIIEPGNIIFRLTDLQNDKRSLRTGLCKEQGIITSAYITLQIKSDDSPRYMHYLFHTYDLCKVFYGMGDGVRQSMNYEDLKCLRILRPDKESQHRIADYLDRKCSLIDSIIAKQQEVIEKLKEYKLSLITEAVTKGLNPDVPMKDSGVEWIGKIPKYWKTVKIKIGVTKVGSGKTPLGGSETYSDKGILFLRSQNIHDTGVILDNPTYITSEVDEEMKSTRVLPNDVLLNITGGSIGRCAIFPKELHTANVNQHVSIIRTKKDIFTSEYMHYYWISDLGQTAIKIYQTGGNREGMSADAIKNSPINLLPIQEQKQISEYLNSKCEKIDFLINKKQKLIDKFIEYKKSLIYEVVTGKKEV